MKIVETNSLAIVNPSLSNEWHPTKNSGLTPKDVLPYSNKKIWWKCNKGHEWETQVNHRSKGSGCPYCSGRRTCEDNCLQTVNPVLASEWHPTKNRDLTPKDVTIGSNKKVWWQCIRGHEWQATINNRKRSIGGRCPYCHSHTSELELIIFCEMKHIFEKVMHREKILGKEVDIYIPELGFAIEVDGFFWHKGKYTEDKRKSEFFESRGIVLLGIREKGLKKISETDIFCSTRGNHFNTILRILNYIIKTFTLSQSLRISVHRYLKRKSFANDKEFRRIWEMLPSPLSGKSLKDIMPHVANEWHPSKNEKLTPKDVAPYSERKVWWKCSKGHEWKSRVASRSRGHACPYCSNQAICEENCLKTVNPSLAKEWHPTKNNDLAPEDVTPYTHKKVWWQCSKGHEWQASIANRSKGSGCPYCSSQAVCEDNCLKTFNPSLVKEWHPTKNKALTPTDVMPNSNKKVWWKCVRGHEWQAQINTRYKGSGCPYCSGRRALEENCLQSVNPILSNQWHKTKNGDLTPKDVKPYSNKKVWWQCQRGHEWQATIGSRSLGRGCPYCSGRRVLEEEYLQNVNPQLVKEWHPTKNADLRLKNVKPYSRKNVWWRCSKGHEWQDSVINRMMASDCPYCLDQPVFKDNCLQTANRALALEWHPTKNKDLTPKDVTTGSKKKVWWQCSKGHKWQATINSRTSGSGCPYCSNKAVFEDNCLQTINPSLAKDWHPTKNGDLTPKDVTPSSGKKIWWLCQRGHEWQAVVSNRTAGNKCPYCSNKAVGEDNCLQTLNPELANEWHPTKNRDFTPKQVTPGSRKKVWWQCSVGHEWQAKVYTRNKGAGCPYCSGRRACEDNCLQTLNPSLAKEWHSDKNGYLTPKKVTPGSHKKVWWLCSNGHEWEAIIRNRSRGCNCPYCNEFMSGVICQS